MKRVYLVRHGATPGNDMGMYQPPDEPLNEAGEAGARTVAERIAILNAEVILASHFTRAQQTATIIASHTGLPIETHECFHEILNAEFVWNLSKSGEETKAYRKEHEQYYTDPEWSPGGAENLPTVLVRVKEAVEVLETSSAQNIVVVSHGNFLRHLFAYLLLQKTAEPLEIMKILNSLYDMSNVALTEFTYEKDTWKMFTWNDQAHFAE